MVKERVPAKVCQSSLILWLLEIPLHHTTIQVELNSGISLKYSEEVPIRIDSHSAPVEVNLSLMLLSILFCTDLDKLHGVCAFKN